MLVNSCCDGKSEKELAKKSSKRREAMKRVEGRDDMFGHLSRNQDAMLPAGAGLCFYWPLCHWIEIYITL